MAIDTLDPGASDSPRPPRSFVACACFALGLLVARAVPELNAGTWFALACAAAAVAAATAGSLCKWALGAATVLLGAGWFALRIWSISGDSLPAHLDRTRPALITVEGLVLDEPRTFPSDGPLAAFAARRPTASCTLRIESIVTPSRTVPSSGSLRLRIAGAEWSFERGLHGFPVAAGHRVRVTGAFEPVRRPVNAGQADARLFAAQNSLAGTIEALDPKLIQTLPPPAGIRALESKLRSWLARTRADARRAIDPGPDASPAARALAFSLLLGDDETGIDEVSTTFTRLGLAHVLAISGFHLALLAALATILLRPFARLDAASPLLVAAAVLAYTMLVPAESPVVRSAAMVFALLVSESLGRRYDRLATLGWIAVGLLIWRPLDLWSLGFQLSLGLTAALLWLAPRFDARVWGIEIRGLRPVRHGVFMRGARWAGRQAGRGLSTTLLCWLLSVPLIAHTTGLVSLATIPATLIVLPLTIALMAAGFVGALATGVLHLLGAEGVHLGEWIVRPFAELSAWAADALEGLPFASLRVPPLGIPATVALTALAIYLLCYAHRRDPRLWLALAACTVIFAVDQGARARREATLALAVMPIDVAPGKCTLVRSRSESVLINAGAQSLARPRQTIARTARSLGAWRTRTVVITGATPAHFGGILNCVEPLGVRRVIAAPAFLDLADRDPSGPQAAALRELRRLFVEVTPASEPLTVGECTLEFTATPEGTLQVNIREPSGTVTSLSPSSPP